MKNYNVLTRTELLAEQAATESRLQAIEAAIAAKDAEPDYERFLDAFDAWRDARGWGAKRGRIAEGEKSWIDALIAAYPALKRAMEPQEDGWIEWAGGQCGSSISMERACRIGFAKIAAKPKFASFKGEHNAD